MGKSVLSRLSRCNFEKIVGNLIGGGRFEVKKSFRDSSDGKGLVGISSLSWRMLT